MFVLPLIFVPFVINFPAGLIVYWITTNIWTIGQRIHDQQIIPAPHVATPEEKRGGQTASATAEKEEEATIGAL